MALYVTFKNHNLAAKQWHVGEDFSIPMHETDLVVSVQADGDELTHVIGKFAHLPYPRNTRVVRWFGDWAKLIAGNL